LPRKAIDLLFGPSSVIGQQPPAAPSNEAAGGFLFSKASTAYGIAAGAAILSNFSNFLLDIQIRFGMGRIRENTEYTPAQ
jgi:hypothetical protein